MSNYQSLIGTIQRNPQKYPSAHALVEKQRYNFEALKAAMQQDILGSTFGEKWNAEKRIPDTRNHITKSITTKSVAKLITARTIKEIAEKQRLDHLAANKLRAEEHIAQTLQQTRTMVLRNERVNAYVSADAQFKREQTLLTEGELFEFVTECKARPTISSARAVITRINQMGRASSPATRMVFNLSDRW